MKRFRYWIADLFVRLALSLAGLRPVVGATEGEKNKDGSWTVGDGAKLGVAPAVGNAPAGYAGPATGVGGQAGVWALVQAYFSGAGQGGCSIYYGTGIPGVASAPGGTAPVLGDLYIRTDGGGVGSTHLYFCTLGGGAATWLGIA